MLFEKIYDRHFLGEDDQQTHTLIFCVGAYRVLIESKLIRHRLYEIVLYMWNHSGWNLIQSETFSDGDQEEAIERMKELYVKFVDGAS